MTSSTPARFMAPQGRGSNAPNRGWRRLLLALGALALGASSVAAQQPLPFTPPIPLGPDESFTFAAFGDVQGNHRQGLDALARQMQTEADVSLILCSGDISPDRGENYSQHFYPAMESLARRAPVLAAPGNHDIDWTAPASSRLNFRSFFSELYGYLDREGQNPHLAGANNNRTWYHLVHEDVLFILLDSNLFIDEGKYRKAHALAPFPDYRREQLLWVQGVLERYGEDPEIRAIFVAFHHSPFITYEAGGFLGLGGHPGHSEMVVNVRLPSKPGEPDEFLLDLFRRARVTAVFTGHEHYYERWVETLSRGGTPIHDLHWVVSGQGGVKPRGRAEYEESTIRDLLSRNDAYQSYLSRVSEVEPGLSSELVHAFPNERDPSSTFHSYVLVTVGDEEIRFETKDIDGRTRDTWTTPMKPPAPKSQGS